MNEIGKASQNFLKEFIFKYLGKKNKNVIFGPKIGGDFSIIKINEKNVLIICADPLSIIPSMGMKDSAWLTVHLLASDLTTSGVKPMFAAFSYNLPPHLNYENFKKYWFYLHKELKKLGIMVVAGHTGKYVGCDFTVVGGGVMFSITEKDNYVTTKMAKVGNSLVLTKGVAIAASSILAKTFKEKVEKELGKKTQKKLENMFKNFSTVKDALIASKLGLRKVITAMHDCTEGGLLGGISELCEAAKVGIEIYKENIKIEEEIESICKLFNINPLKALNEGGLLICVNKENTEELIKELKKNRIKAFEIGKLKDKNYGRFLIDKDKKIKIKPIEIDPYWKAFWNAINKGWK